MKGITRIRNPGSCTDEERHEFGHLIQQGFPGAVDLENRILDAAWLAFHYADEDTLSAIAALKGPDQVYRREVFRNAVAPADPDAYRLELGWIYVVPTQRGKRIAENLCRRLLERVSQCNLFATTRPDNSPMIEILLALGFERVGQPYQWRDEELTLYLRPAP